MADLDIVDPQGRNDPHLAKSVQPASLGSVPQMEMERVLPRQQSTGLARGVQQLGTPNVFVDSGDNQIIVAKDATNQVLMGDQPNFGEGFFVTKPGIDVKTAKNLDDFVFNSNQNTLKIVSTGVRRISFVSSPFSVFKLEHNLEFAPIPLAFLTNVTDGIASGNFPYPASLSTTVDLVNGFIKIGASLHVAADKTYVYFECVNALGVALGAFDVRYYLLQETSGSN